MKILIICNYKPGKGGISGQVEILARKLQAEGHLVDIFSTKSPTPKRLTVPFLLLQRATKYDILHIHCSSCWGFMPAVVGICIGRILGKRTVTTYHGGGGDRFFARHHRFVHYWLSRSSCNIVLNGFLAKVYGEHNLPYTIVPNIIEFDSSHYRKKNTISSRFICVRAHEELYNIPCVLRAFGKVQTILPEASLMLVGDGSLHASLVQQAEDMHLHNVTFTGRVDNGKIYDYLSQADIMVSASTQDNMPVSLLESMNAGVLVISSRVGGVPYMVEDNITGLLFESDNVAELAEKMIWAVENPTAAISIIQTANNAVNQYQWGNIKEKLYHAYGITA